MALTPIECTKDGCDYKTPPNCPDWDKMIKLLELHGMTEHGVRGASQDRAPSQTPKLERLPRPVSS